MKILLVDDDECQLKWCSDQLEKRGYSVETALSGEQGLHIYQNAGPWEFVLSDYLFIPSERIRNGLDFAREIRAINPQQPMAIHTSAEHLQASVPVLLKPYPIGKLLRLLRQPIKSLALPFA